MEINKQISNNFNLEEFLQSPTATRKKYLEQFQPSDDIIDNIEELVIKVLQPLRNLLPFGTIHITSGYRCKRVNTDVGGQINSQHLTGCAADCCYYEDGVKSNKKLEDTIVKSGLPFDQVINEFGNSWIHISHVKNNNRGQHFSIK